MNWYTIRNIDTVDSPALIVYPERVKENIAKAIAMAGNADVMRPHVKTHKMETVCRMMLGAGIRKFKCATIAEAEMLGMASAPDVLIAHQPSGPKILRLLSLCRKYPNTSYSCIIDNAGTARELSDAFSGSGITLPVFIDLNTGMGRSGLPAEKAIALIAACLQLPGIIVAGLHAYDGHVRDTDPAQRNRHSDEAFAAVDKLKNDISELHPQLKLRVVAGGSPSFPTHTRRKDVELSPGTFVFWDWGYKQQLPDEPFDYAALVITRVISVMDDKNVCVDLGHKSVAAENPQPRVFFLNAPDAEPEGQSEEHLVLRVPDAGKYAPGDVLYGVPFHICPTVALYDEAVVVENGEAKGTWEVTARRRKITV